MSSLPDLPASSLIRLHDGSAGDDPSRKFVRSRTVDLPADATQQFATLWRRLRPCPEGGMRCYMPAYEISLWNSRTATASGDDQSQELFAAAFCWRCHWIRFRTADEPAKSFAWDAEQPEAAALLELFDSFLPYERRAAPPERCPGCGHSWDGLFVGGICPGCKLTKTTERVWDPRP
jgi:hypothetical protein